LGLSAFRCANERDDELLDSGGQVAGSDVGGNFFDDRTPDHYGVRDLRHFPGLRRG
jgi:hypothetical protein